MHCDRRDVFVSEHVDARQKGHVVGSRCVRQADDVGEVALGRQVGPPPLGVVQRVIRRQPGGQQTALFGWHSPGRYALTSRNCPGLTGRSTSLLSAVAPIAMLMPA